MTRSRLLAAAAALFLPAAAMAESIEGAVDFGGKAPAPGKLHREADPYCAKKTMTDPAVLVKNGKLENVWVHVTKGAKETAKPPADTVEMDQKDCMYEPRMTTAVVGQKIQAKNGDPVLHNVHTYLGSATLFNKGMPNDKAAPIEYVAKDEGMMKWKCDVLDARVHRRLEERPAGGVQGRRVVQDRQRAARQVHGRGLAREVRHQDSGGDRRGRQARKGELQVRRYGKGRGIAPFQA